MVAREHADTTQAATCNHAKYARTEALKVNPNVLRLLAYQGMGRESETITHQAVENLLPNSLLQQGECADCFEAFREELQRQFFLMKKCISAESLYGLSRIQPSQALKPGQEQQARHVQDCSLCQVLFRFLTGNDWKGSPAAYYL